MFGPPARLALLAVVACSLPPVAGTLSSDDAPRTSVAPAFSGRYKFVLTVSRGCPAAMPATPLTVVMDVTEASITQGSEVSGQSASPSEVPADGRFVFLRQGDRLHGAFGASTLELGLVTAEGYLLWMQIMADGTATATGGRSRASGTAFGEIDIGLASDPAAESANCKDALEHQWALEPI